MDPFKVKLGIFQIKLGTFRSKLNTLLNEVGASETKAKVFQIEMSFLQVNYRLSKTVKIIFVNKNLVWFSLKIFVQVAE